MPFFNFKQMTTSTVKNLIKMLPSDKISVVFKDFDIHPIFSQQNTPTAFLIIFTASLLKKTD